MEQYAIQSVDRALQLLETISLHPQGLSLTELVNQTQLNKSTAYRLLSSLIAHGYVIKDSRSNTYHISLKLYEIGCRTVNANGFLPVVEPVLRGLAVETNEAIHFVLREENSVVYLYKEEPVQSVIRMASRIGVRNPMYCTGVGKAILAFLPQEEQQLIARTTQYQAFTDYTLCTPEALLEDLELTRRRGYAVDDQEHELGIRCVAAPIKNEQGNAYAAISLSAPISRLGEARIQEVANQITTAAMQISQLLNGRMD